MYNNKRQFIPHLKKGYFLPHQLKFTMANNRYYDRYAMFREDGLVGRVPFVKIPESGTDVYVTFDSTKMRFDTLSYKYYSDPDYAWLILQANPHLGGYEYSIPDGSTLRIPYPIDDALVRYEKACTDAKKKGIF